MKTRYADLKPYITRDGSQIRELMGDDRFEVSAGDTIAIAPRTPHCIRTTGTETLRILCSCAPAYAHDDTQLLD